MGTTHARNITPADRAAAERLKALWLNLPRDQRPTQQAMADAWDGDGEANQSLISQYLNGRIALNYLAVQFFARQLGCDATAIRDDLPEQKLTGSVDRARRSQPARLNPQTIVSTTQALNIVLGRRGEKLNLEDADDAVMFAAAYDAMEAIRNSPNSEFERGAVVADLVAEREARRNAGRREQVGGNDRKEARKQGARK